MYYLIAIETFSVNILTYKSIRRILIVYITPRPDGHLANSSGHPDRTGKL